MDHDDGLGIVLPGYYGGSGKFFVKKKYLTATRNSYTKTHEKNWKNRLILVEWPQNAKKVAWIMGKTIGIVPPGHTKGPV